MFGQNGRTVDMELVRLAMPRRVYTQSHMDYVVEATLELFEQRDTIKPLEITYEPRRLRHFTARLREVDTWTVSHAEAPCKGHTGRDPRPSARR